MRSSSAVGSGKRSRPGIGRRSRARQARGVWRQLRGRRSSEDEYAAGGKTPVGAGRAAPASIVPCCRQGVGYHSKAPDPLRRPIADSCPIPTRFPPKRCPGPTKLQHRRPGTDRRTAPSTSAGRRAVQIAAKARHARPAGPRRNAGRARREAVRRARRRGRPPGAARRRHRRGARDHRVGRSQAAAAVRRQADARPGSRHLSAGASTCGHRATTSTPRGSMRSSAGASGCWRNPTRSTHSPPTYPRARSAAHCARSSRARSKSAAGGCRRTRFASSFAR